MIIKEIDSQNTWLIRQEVMWPNQPVDYVKLKDDNVGIHFGVFIKEELAAVVSLFVSNEEAQFRKLATYPKYQQKGLATALIKHLFDHCKRHGIKRIWCNARTQKTSFYERFGMKTTPRVFNKGGIDYVIMEYIIG